MEQQQRSWRHSLTQQKWLENAVCLRRKAAAHWKSGRWEGVQLGEALG